MVTRILKDDVAKLFSTMEKMSRVRVLVGIPGDADQRQDPKEPPNHVLGYIHEFGDPSRNIPARPFLRPGVANAQPQIIAALRQGLRIALKLDKDGKAVALLSMGRAGQIAASSVQQKIVDGPFIPLSPRTIADRARKRIAIDWAGMRAWRKANPGQAVNMLDWVSDKPLIATGAMRQSITYVVEDR